MIPQDKLKHFAAGAAVALLALAVWALLGHKGYVRMHDAGFAAVLCAAVAGAIKEAADWMDNKIVPGMHGVEWGDFFATAAGAAPVVLAFSLAREFAK